MTAISQITYFFLNTQHTTPATKIISRRAQMIGPIISQIKPASAEINTEVTGQRIETSK